MLDAYDEWERNDGNDDYNYIAERWLGIKRTSNSGSMQVSQNQLDFIKDYEDFSPVPYRGLDSYNETIGYGHVILSGEVFTTITEAEAELLLMKDLKTRVDYVNEQMVSYNLSLNQHQFNGLVDMVFNKGQILTPYYDIFNAIRDGENNTDILYQFSRWNKVTVDGAKVFSLGSYRRSMDSADIFLYGDYIRDDRDEPVVKP